MTKNELIDCEIDFLREQLRFLRRISEAIDRQIDVWSAPDPRRAAQTRE
jgi:hypothetical protein